MARNSKHAHRYEKRDMQSFAGKIWMCTLPNCTHYQPKHLEKMLIGRMATCNTCDNTYVMTPEKLQYDQPICDDCLTEREMRIARFKENREKRNESSELDLTGIKFPE